MKRIILFLILITVLLTPSGAQLSYSFTKIADTPDINPTDIAIGPDGTIFVAAHRNGRSCLGRVPVRSHP